MVGTAHAARPTGLAVAIRRLRVDIAAMAHVRMTGAPAAA